MCGRNSVSDCAFVLVLLYLLIFESCRIVHTPYTKLDLDARTMPQKCSSSLEWMEAGHFRLYLCASGGGLWVVSDRFLSLLVSLGDTSGAGERWTAGYQEIANESASTARL